jgi:hypothetical protein
MDGPGTSRRQGMQDLPGRICICGGTYLGAALIVEHDPC